MKRSSSKENKTPPAKSSARKESAPAQNKSPEKSPEAPRDNALESLLEYLERTRGFDFRSYKRSSLSRRIIKRMHDVHIENYSDYIDYLEVHPEEFAQLFNTILINVTTFFRDTEAWELLRDQLVPRLVKNKKPGEPIRIWTAGCASGEEAYSIAMLLADAMGPEPFRERVKIYGTDADEEALNQARQAVYLPAQVEQVPPEYLKKYFDLVNGRYVFSKELRRSIIFGRHDLLQDAPISRVDLITCRNTLMYFNSEAQARIAARFVFALNDSGLLFLGKAETLPGRLNLFQPVDLKHRLFNKIPHAVPRERLLAATQVVNGFTANHNTEDLRLREVALDIDPVAQIVVDDQGVLVLANEAARSLFGLGFNDLGRPLQDLEVSYRPVELRSLIEQAHIERHAVTVKEIAFPADSPNPRYYDLTVIPLFDLGSNTLGTKAIFSDVTRFWRLQEELRQSHQELETAYEELQSANEELETTNEELQSTVEELETMNEELQSTNEELETANEQLRLRGEELDEVNRFNEVILNRMLGGMIVVDRDLRVTAWNRRSEELWGLRAEEVQTRNLLNLDIGLPVHELRQPIRKLLSGESEAEELTMPAINRRGKKIQVRITFAPLDHLGKETVGAILMVDELNHEGK